jgi:beta-lactamase regulating signal transducer with metallopeptidase domain
VTGAIVLALAVSVLFAAAGPRLARTLAPTAAVQLLVPAAVLVAVCSVFVLAAVAFTGAAQLGEVAEFGHWSPEAMHALSPISESVSLVAGLVLFLSAGWACACVARTVWALRAIRRACQGLAATGQVVIVDSDRVDAFTTAGLSGRIVVTTALLNALDDDQRQALIAHERSHLTHRHPWWTMTANLAAAVNPMLRPTAQAIRQACERWADEDAAGVTSRRLVATTVAYAALLMAQQRHTGQPVTGATGGEVPARVKALMRPPPRTRPAHVGIVVVMVATVVTSTLLVQLDTETLFEQALQPDVSTSTHGRLDR